VPETRRDRSQSPLGDRLDFLFGRGGDAEIVEQAIAEAIDAPVDAETLASGPGMLDEGVFAKNAYLLDDIQLAEAVEAIGLARGSLEKGAILFRKDGDGVKPVVNESEITGIQGCLDAAAAVVAGDEDVLHAQNLDGVLHDREAIEIGVHDEVRHIAVDEDFAGLEPDDFVRGDAAVRAADPQVARRLLARE
jgi:hypothetical protein